MHDAALATEHDSGSQQHHACTEMARLERLAFPTLAKLREKARAGGCALIDLALAAVAVNAGCRCVDQNARLLAATHRFDDVPRAVDAALRDGLLFFLSPN